MAEQKPEHTFEKDLERLEKIVDALESGDLSLDDSLKQFEEGIGLARKCEKAITEAEKKIEILLKKADGSVQAEPFDEETASPEETSTPRKASRKHRTESTGSDEEDADDDETDENDTFLF